MSTLNFYVFASKFSRMFLADFFSNSLWSFRSLCRRLVGFCVDSAQLLRGRESVGFCRVYSAVLTPRDLCWADQGFHIRGNFILLGKDDKFEIDFH